MTDRTRTYRSPRRELAASQTRQDLLDAARRLFAQRGFARVTVADIAREAGTAVKTVYASVGTKADLLVTLLDADMAASGADATIEDVRHLDDLEAVTRRLAAGTRIAHEHNRAALDLMYSSLASHEAAERAWQHVLTEYRRQLGRAAEHLHDRGLLPDGLDVAAATDLLWFCFGIASWRTLVIECGWDFDRAERWLGDQAARMLAEPPA